MGSEADVTKYEKDKGLRGNAWHGTGTPPSEYGIKYIPHKVLVDADGKVVKNFSLKLPGDLDELLAGSKKSS